MSPTPSAASMPPPRLTLIVAVTPSHGIGRAGTLPWPRIKSEMAYFARVTKRVPKSVSGSAFDPAGPAESSAGPGPRNAVIMGRKTWESIPARFRPLAGRVNVVVSRQADGLDLGGAEATFAAGGLAEAVGRLRERHAGAVERVFVIGGAQIYAEALKAREADRVLLTRIKQDYECDTFFPVEFGSGKGDAQGWTLQSEGARDEWLGEQGLGGEEWDVEMWTREQEAA